MKKVKLGELCEILNGYAFKSQQYVEDGIRVIRITNVQKGVIEDNDPKFYPMSEKDKLKNYILYENDLLISLTGNVGRVGLLKQNLLPAALNQRVGCLRAKTKEINIKYLYQALNNTMFENECINNSKGIAQKNLSTEWLKNQYVNVPSLEEQVKITDKMEKIQDIISLKQKQITDLDELIKSQFVEMFGDIKTNKYNWEISELQTYFDVKGGKRIPKGMNYSDIPTKHVYLRATDMKNATIIDNDIKYIDDEVFEKIKRYTVEAEDIYITNVGVNLGMAGVIPEKYSGANLTENAVKLVKKTEKINGKYLAYYINSEEAQYYINQRKMSVGVPKLAIFRIQTMPLMIPPIELQNQFVKKLEQIDKQKFEIENSLKKMQELYESLMEKYFG